MVVRAVQGRRHELVLQHAVPVEVIRPTRDAHRLAKGRAMRSAVFVCGAGTLSPGNAQTGRGRGGRTPAFWAMKALAGHRDLRFVAEEGSSAHCCGCYGPLQWATRTVCASTRAKCPHAGQSGGGCFGHGGTCRGKVVGDRMNLFCASRACPVPVHVPRVCCSL